MKILLLGNTGQLGWELQRCLPPLGDVHGLDYPQIDLANPETLREVIRAYKPDTIVNSTAYTAVDVAESKSDLAYAINAKASAVMAEEAKALNATLIHYSTDYVFDGAKGSTYVETDATNPLNVYGASKLAGEQAIQSVASSYLIFRTAWVYSLRRDSFVTKTLQWARQNETLRLVDDQISNPTWARMLAEITAQVLARGGDYIRERAGLYHLAGDGFASRLEWARLVLELDPNRHEQMVKEILPAPTSDFPTPATRPLFSALNCDRFTSTFGLRLPSWESTLRMAMDR
ncbi:dTDP-4-dehydrorhamnose reductase [Candidatus Villigracilis affinis]|uniref:dTDP-4-dehydrorhamnose reductase n=1 Tax=Candidatus Villigracilis affinis TaxID=3140682 RepID=UPI002A191B2C|nr:dTDP-4-dehydrorhamnose reductase [Anaerolineales bacterium]